MIFVKEIQVSADKSYYKYWGEDMHGIEGLTYIEFTNNTCTRQISFHDKRRLFLTYPKDLWDMCRVPLPDMALSENEAISAQEFEKMWSVQI